MKLTTDVESIAYQEQRKLFSAKANKGYADIDSPSYSGPVDRSTQCVLINLEDEKATPVKQTPKPVVKKVPPPEPDPDELVCTDNAGMEEEFDVGITYVVEPHKDSSMIWAYDRYGEKKACLRERFKTEKEFEASGV